ncbi:MAG TPA: hypothetical protein VGV37_06300 [Aliidongia sp.]|uniref:hypothetical protein n=1 Tax=Aliidongia sp. TaxID=1914230 RepID=UPI002DDD22A6|nr:hypothetical protein [Aliidongia sp.]HEV2674136.1 hypothetical protein [Aliidongia sp.]
MHEEALRRVKLSIERQMSGDFANAFDYSEEMEIKIIMGSAVVCTVSGVFAIDEAGNAAAFDRRKLH